MAWELGSRALQRMSDALSKVEVFTFFAARDSNVRGAAWPRELKTVRLGKWFNQPISGVARPQSLQEQILDFRFNHPIVGVSRPASLEILDLGAGFN